MNAGEDLKVTLGFVFAMLPVVITRKALHTHHTRKGHHRIINSDKKVTKTLFFWHMALWAMVRPATIVSESEPVHCRVYNLQFGVKT